MGACQVSHVKREGNAARFNNLSLYIQRQCLTKWKADASDQTTVYVNIYNSGIYIHIYTHTLTHTHTIYI